MVGWLCFSVVILIIIFIPISVDFQYSESVAVKVKVWLFTVYKTRNEEKAKPKKPKKEKKKPPKAPKKEKDNLIKTMFKQHGVGGFSKFISSLIEIVAKMTYRMGRKPFLKRCDIKIVVAEGDPAKTAVRYGEICSVFYPLMSLLWNTVRYRERQAEVTVDYFSSKTKVMCRIELQQRISRILWALIRAAVSSLKVLVQYRIINTNKKGSEAKCQRKQQQE